MSTLVAAESISSCCTEARGASTCPLNCGVCLEPLFPEVHRSKSLAKILATCVSFKQELPAQRPLTVLSCGHVLHSDCYFKMVVHSSSDQPTCPCCRSTQAGDWKCEAAPTILRSATQWLLLNTLLPLVGQQQNLSNSENLRNDDLTLPSHSSLVDVTERSNRHWARRTRRRRRRPRSQSEGSNRNIRRRINNVRFPRESVQTVIDLLQKLVSTDEEQTNYSIRWLQQRLRCENFEPLEPRVIQLLDKIREEARLALSKLHRTEVAREHCLRRRIGAISNVINACSI